MIIRINSQNNYLLDTLNKNPNTDYGLYALKNRNGVILGRVENIHEYHCLFQDTKHSYTRYEDNQIDFKSFCAPEVVLTIITELFRHLLKERAEVENSKISWLDKTVKEVDDKPCKIHLDNVWCDSNWYRDGQFMLSRYIPGITLDEKNQFHLMSLNIEDNTIVGALNKTILVAFFLHLTNKSHSFLDQSIVEKYARILTNLSDVPYFVYYLFIKRAAFSEKRFSAIRKDMEAAYKKYTGRVVSFTKNDTHTDRHFWILEKLLPDIAILDFGCGEFRLTKQLSKTNAKKVISYDIEDYSELYQKQKSRYPTLNWHYINNLDELPNDELVAVVLTEVVEHNEPEEIKAEIKKLIREKNVRQLLITTPNSTFNQYYSMEEEFRNDDHKWEANKNEFVEFVTDIIEEFDTEYVRFDSIGDVVDDEPVTLGVNIKFV